MNKKVYLNEDMSAEYAALHENYNNSNTNPQNSHNEKKKSGLFIIIKLIPFIISAVFFASTAISIYRYVKYNACTETTTGIVTDITTKSHRSTTGKYKSSHHTSYTYYPVCEFETDGKIYSFKSKTDANVEIGNAVDICYEPNNPENAWLTGSGKAYTTSAAITGIIGFILLVLSIKWSKFLRS